MSAGSDETDFSTNVRPFPRAYSPPRTGTVQPLIFAEGWQQVCREVLATYALLNGRRGVPMKDTALRNAIADRYEDHHATVVTEGDLSRQHLQAFIKKRHNIVGHHFRYIDWFVRSIQFSPEYQTVFERLRLESEIVHKRVLARLYQSRNTLEWQHSVRAFESVAGYVFEIDNPYAHVQSLLDLTANEYRYIGLFIKPDSGPIFTAQSIHSLVPIAQLLSGESHSSVRHVIYSGYLIPQAQTFNVHETFRGVLKLFDPKQDHSDMEDASTGVSSHTSSIIRVLPRKLELSATWDGVIFSPVNNTMHLIKDDHKGSFFTGKEGRLVNFGVVGTQDQYNKAIENLTADYGLW